MIASSNNPEVSIEVEEEKNPHQHDNVPSMAEWIKSAQEKTFIQQINALKDANQPNIDSADVLESLVKVNMPQQRMFRMYLHCVYTMYDNDVPIEASVICYEEKPLKSDFINYMKLYAAKVITGAFPNIKINYKLAPPYDVQTNWSQKLVDEDLVYFVRFLGIGKYPFAYDGKRTTINRVIVDLVRQAQQIVADQNRQIPQPKLHLRYNGKMLGDASGSLGDEFLKGMFQIIGTLNFTMEYLKKIIKSILENGKLVPQKERIAVLTQFVSGKRHSLSQILSVTTKMEKAGIRHVLGVNENTLQHLEEDFKKVIQKLKLNPSDQKMREKDKEIQAILSCIPLPVFSCLYARIKTRNTIIRERTALLLNQNKDQPQKVDVRKKAREGVTLQEVFKRMATDRKSPLYSNPYHVALICYVEDQWYDEILAVSSNPVYYILDPSGIYRPTIEYLQWLVDNCAEKSLAEQALREIKFLAEKQASMARLQGGLNVPFQNVQNQPIIGSQQKGILLNQQDNKSKHQAPVKPNAKGKFQGKKGGKGYNAPPSNNKEKEAGD